jgi:Xaa-Pro aminopeptidase
MKADLDDLLRSNAMDALLVIGPARHNPAMVYLTGLLHVSDGLLVKPRGRAPVLYCFPMEREEAARSGLETRVLNWHEFNQTVKGDTVELMARLCQHVLGEQRVTGRVAVYGQMEMGEALGALRTVEERMPQVRFVSESKHISVLGRARVTKDAGEVERIRRMGKVTVEVVGAVVDFLSSQSVAGGHLVAKSGKPITVGEVKRLIHRLLSERGAEDPEGTIFSVGRDAGIPHSAGLDGDLLPIGKPVLLDLFPCEAGGGYFYDFTRTWCLGHAPDDLAAVHELVLKAHQQSLASLRPGIQAMSVQERVCDLFEAQGHPTVRSQPNTQNGYVHSLGHGLGLEVHEPPAFRASVEGQVALEPGMVFAIEPGLYYPEREIGLRLEDTVWLRPDGKPEVLAPYPMDLVLPVRSRRKTSTIRKGKGPGHRAKL